MYRETNWTSEIIIREYTGHRIIVAHILKNSTLDGGEWSTSHPGRFNPINELRYPFNRRMGGSQSRSGRFREQKNILFLPGFEPRIVELVA
jgi:hypothetical protein